MLGADVISSDFELNSFDVIGALSFIPGEDTVLALRLKQLQRKDLLRYVPPTAAILTVTLNQADGTTVDIVMTKLTDDRSIWSTPLSAAQTANLIGGNFTFSLDVNGDGSVINKGFVQNGLSLINTGSCC